MLALLCNENVPRLLIRTLRDRGHDVRWVLEENRGMADPAVLEEALSQRRVLLTFDKDFGELVFQRGKGQLAASSWFAFWARNRKPIWFKLSCPRWKRMNRPGPIISRLSSADAYA